MLRCAAVMLRRPQALGSTARAARPGLVAIAAVAALCAGCGGAAERALPPPPVDLLAEAAAAEMVIHDERLAGNLADLSGAEPDRALVEELARLGLAPGGPSGRWYRDAVELDTVARPVGPWSLRRDGQEVSVGTDELEVRLAGDAGAAIRGAELAFVGTGLPHEDSGGSLRGKVWLVLPSPEGPGLAPAELAAAARLGAAGVVVGAADAAGQQRAAVDPSSLGSGPQVVARWSPAATHRVLELAGTGPEALRRFAGHADFAPLPLGIATHAEVTALPRRRRSRHLVARLPGRRAEGESVLVVATRPPEGGAGSPSSRLASAASLAVARAFQALTAPPRRDVLFVFPPAAEGPGVAQLFGPGRWSRERTAGGVVIAAVGEASRSVRSPGLSASPLRGLVAGLARVQGRPLLEPPSTSWLAGTPAGDLLVVGVPAVSLVTGGGPVSLSEDVREAVSALPSAAVLDARLAFRAALRLAEDRKRPPRVDSAAVIAALSRDAEAARAALEAAERPERAPRRGSAPASPDPEEPPRPR